jgi:hypothetical protein
MVRYDRVKHADRDDGADEQELRQQHRLIGSVIVQMFGIVVTVHVLVHDTVGVAVLVFVKRDFKTATEAVGDAAERGDARYVLAAFEPRDHGLGHREPMRELPLRFAGLHAKNVELVREAYRYAVGGVEFLGSLGPRTRSMGHAASIAKMLSMVNYERKSNERWILLRFQGCRAAKSKRQIAFGRLGLAGATIRLL